MTHMKTPDAADVPAPIKERVHELYWKHDVNCARTVLHCLGELFDLTIERQTLDAAVGLHGAGGYGAQCGLVEGALMFIGVYCGNAGKNEKDIAGLCYRYADAFTGAFGSLLCRDLRPGGFAPSDPPHLCESLSCRAVAFAYDFIRRLEA